MYVTYPDLIQIGIFLVALISLIIEIYKARKQPPTTTNSERLYKQFITTLGVGQMFLAFPSLIYHIYFLCAMIKYI